MKTNSYLYGEGVEVPEIDSYVIVRRIELLKEHLDDLMEEHYLERDTEKVRAILKAIDFWSKINEKEI